MDLLAFFMWCDYYATQVMAGARVTIPENLRACVTIVKKQKRAAQAAERAAAEKAAAQAAAAKAAATKAAAAKAAANARRAAACRRRALAVMYDPHPAWARARVPKSMRACVTNALKHLTAECDSLARDVVNGKKTPIPDNLRNCVTLAAQKARAGTDANTGKPRWIGPLNFSAS